jgi:predicted anti-sigma-YlaC factor YlaD
MNCETTRELLALRLYDELERDEGARIDAHLAECGDCRALDADLGRGLGRLGASPAVLERAAEPAARRFRSVHVVAAFAAGWLVSGLLYTALAESTPTPPAAGGATSVEVASTFRRSDPPPPAERVGRLAPLGAWMRR